MLLCDPSQNEFEVKVEKKNGRVYFTDGWAGLKNFYKISRCWFQVLVDVLEIIFVLL
jgi:hypothetical protein